MRNTSVFPGAMRHVINNIMWRLDWPFVTIHETPTRKGRCCIEMEDQPARGDASGSKAEQRRAEIIRMLSDGSTIQIKDLAQSLDVSLMTIHRDLLFLQEQGFVRRMRGVVSAEKSMLFESNYHYRARQKIEEKRRLARAAIRHIEPGNAVMWDDSTTTFHVTEFIQEVSPVTVITNAFPVLEALQDNPDIALIAIGGKYVRSYNGFFGIYCEKAISSFRVDVALLSTTTVQGLSLFTQDEVVVRAKQAMMAVARKKVLLVDQSKFHFSALNHFADLTDFDIVIAPKELDGQLVNRLTSGGVNFELV